MASAASGDPPGLWRIRSTSVVYIPDVTSIRPWMSSSFIETPAVGGRDSWCRHGGGTIGAEPFVDLLPCAVHLHDFAYARARKRFFEHSSVLLHALGQLRLSLAGHRWFLLSTFRSSRRAVCVRLCAGATCKSIQRRRVWHTQLSTHAAALQCAIGDDEVLPSRSCALALCDCGPALHARRVRTTLPE